MKDLTEKVETLEKLAVQFGNIFDDIKKSLAGGEHGEQPVWLQTLVKCCSGLSADLDDVQETLSTCRFTDPKNVQSDAFAPDVRAQSDAFAPDVRAPPDAEPQPGAHQAPTPTQSETEPVSPAIPEIGRQKTISIDRSVPRGHAFNLASLDHDVRPPRRAEEHVHCKLALSRSTSKPSRLTIQQSNAQLHRHLENEIAPTFRCKWEEISSNKKESKYEKLSSDPIVKKKGYFKLIVEDLPPLILDEASISQPGRDHFTNFSCRRDSKGFVVVTKAQKREVQLPSFPFPQTQMSWSQSEQKGLWESIIKDPPADMPYIIGEGLFRDIQLSPGKRLEGIGGREIRGVGTTYGYLSPGSSITICHSEDADFASENLLRAGATKLWLLIEPVHNKELERRMRREFPGMRQCSQALRHLNRIIPPSKLDEWGIEYSLVDIAPGELMVTQRGTRHQVLNLGPNYALSINTLFGPSPDIPLDYRFCGTDCGSHALKRADFRLPEQGPLVDVRGNRRACLQPEKPSVVQSNAGLKRKALPTESQLRKIQLTPQLGSLLEVVCGRQAFHSLRLLIHSWRDRSKPFFEKNDGRLPAVQLVQVLGALEKRSQLTEFLERFVKVKLVENIDGGKEGRTRADPEAISNLINGLGWANIKQNRTKLHHYLDEGRRWKKLCRDFDGLLCLIPPNRSDGKNLQISGRVCLQLSDKDIEQLHSSLKPNGLVQLMCRVGKTLQESIWCDKEVPEFKWEREDPQTIARLPLEDLAFFIEKFPFEGEVKFDAQKFDWRKPDFWPWCWPESPDWVPPSEKQCDLCEDTDCKCIKTRLPKNKPRITNEAGKGQGVRVVGMTYQKGQILDLLGGEFVPLETYHDGWAMEFIRPDLDNEPIAQIYTKERGNWASKVNHSCKPSAEFRFMKIKKKWRVVIVAIQDIPHNGEITADCGRGFLQGKECLCDLCCSRRANLRD